MTTPNAMSSSYLFDIATGLLTAAATVLTEYGITPPARRYVADGDTAHDCEQLTVVVERIMAGQTGRPRLEPVAPGTELYLDLAVECVRCVPELVDTGTPPSPAYLNASALELLADQWALISGFMAGRFSAVYQRIQLTDHTRVGPSGGFGGSRLRFSLQL